ncbi:hypothetical protein GCM10027456_52520 [Kineosporia babensis]
MTGRVYGFFMSCRGTDCSMIPQTRLSPLTFTLYVAFAVMVDGPEMLTRAAAAPYVVLLGALGLNTPFGVTVPITPGSRVTGVLSAAPAGAMDPTATGSTSRLAMLRARTVLVTVRERMGSAEGLGNCGSRSLGRRRRIPAGAASPSFCDYG